MVKDRNATPKARVISYISNKNNRKETCNKRRAGIIKKAHELSILTGNEILLLTVSEDGQCVNSFATEKFTGLFEDSSPDNQVFKDYIMTMGLDPKIVNGSLIKSDIEIPTPNSSPNTFERSELAKPDAVASSKQSFPNLETQKRNFIESTSFTIPDFQPYLSPDSGFVDSLSQNNLNNSIQDYSTSLKNQAFHSSNYSNYAQTAHDVNSNNVCYNFSGNVDRNDGTNIDSLYRLDPSPADQLETFILQYHNYPYI